MVLTGASRCGWALILRYAGFICDEILQTAVAKSEKQHDSTSSKISEANALLLLSTIQELSPLVEAIASCRTSAEDRRLFSYSEW